jgi:hypothetical protein
MNMSSEELDTLAARFAAATLRKEEWTHGAHLSVAAWYLAHYPPLEAGVRLRSGIRKLNDALGGQNTATAGFHETLTEFWIRLVARWLSAHGSSAESITRLLTHPDAASGIWKRCYEFNVAQCTKARRQWIAPVRWPDLA